MCACVGLPIECLYELHSTYYEETLANPVTPRGLLRAPANVGNLLTARSNETVLDLVGQRLHSSRPPGDALSVAVAN